MILISTVSATSSFHCHLFKLKLNLPGKLIHLIHIYFHHYYLFSCKKVVVQELIEYFTRIMAIRLDEGKSPFHYRISKDSKESITIVNDINWSVDYYIAVKDE